MRMLQINIRLLLAILFGAGLGSCQRDKPAHAERAEPVAPAPALRDSLPETPATGQAPTRSWHQLARRTAPNAPLVYRRGTFRPAAADSAVPPTEARLHDLTLKASEYFKIDPTQPAEVHGREGTVVHIPAKILVDSRQVPAIGPVWVELKECYTVADMLLSNLSTVTADGELLNSGGIVLVRASARGQQLQVAAGRAFQLQVPFARRQRGMRLFYGKATRRQQPPAYWVAAGPVSSAPAVERVATQATQMPSYGNGPADINRLIRYPQTALDHQTQGLVYASFVVDEKGQVVAPTILRGLGDGCDEEVLRVLRQTSGHWTPAQQGGEFVKVKMTLPIRFSFQPGQMTSPAEPGPPSAADATSVAATDDDSPDAEETFETAADHYVFQAGQLGWLTCERVWRPAGVPASFLALTDSDPTTSVHLVFRESTTIVAGQPQAEGYRFAAVPTNERAMLVAVQYRNGTPYLAMRETVIGQPDATALDFHETTLAELERALEKLQ